MNFIQKANVFQGLKPIKAPPSSKVHPTPKENQKQRPLVSTCDWEVTDVERDIYIERERESGESEMSYNCI